MSKKVLIMSACTGGGHNRAARACRRAARGTDSLFFQWINGMFSGWLFGS